MPHASFASRLIAWQVRHGRHGLPWQDTRDPYRVWLSEVMLQQTQVAAVLGYYARFLQRFPDVASLAAAGQVDVLGLWSGLGYYSRARNLHRCAQVVMAGHGGQFPRSAAELAGLPGIGPSTAAAIAAFCFGERVSIFDGNVQRVLARWTAFGDDLAQAKARRQLQARAEALLPARAASMPAYTQGLMDLGATLCTPRQPRCEACPVAADCQALQQGEPARWPVKSRLIRRRTQAMWLLMVRRADGAVWMAHRPQSGIWAGLLCPPGFDDEASLRVAVDGRSTRRLLALPPTRHVLTHRDLELHPVWLDWRGAADPPAQGAWVEPARWADAALPKPLRGLLAADPFGPSDQPASEPGR